jgi:hypothetical protein
MAGISFFIFIKLGTVQIYLHGFLKTTYIPGHVLSELKRCTVVDPDMMASDAASAAAFISAEIKLSLCSSIA